MIHRTYHTSDLSIQNGDKTWSIRVAENDVFDVVYESDAGAFESVDARMRRCDTLDVIPPTGIYEVDTLGEFVIVTVSNLDRGYSYELLVTVTYDDETTASGTFVIECVA